MDRPVMLVRDDLTSKIPFDINAINTTTYDSSDPVVVGRRNTQAHELCSGALSATVTQEMRCGGTLASPSEARHLSRVPILSKPSSIV
jgi:hypothetical protein